MLAPMFETPRVALTAEGVIEGYASLFGAVDQARDMVMPGAFTQTLKSRGLRRIPMLFQHDPSEPVGIWLELREDIRGLWARGKLIPDVRRARELLALLEAGAVDGLSIGYRTRRGQIEPQSRVRKLYQVDLWEVSIVTFPLLDGARISAVKHHASPRPRGAAGITTAISTTCTLRSRAGRKHALGAVAARARFFPPSPATPDSTRRPS